MLRQPLPGLLLRDLKVVLWALVIGPFDSGLVGIWHILGVYLGSRLRTHIRGPW